MTEKVVWVVSEPVEIVVLGMLQEVAVRVCTTVLVLTLRTVQVVSTPEAETVRVELPPAVTRSGFAVIVGFGVPQDTGAVTVTFGQARVAPPAVTDMLYVPADA